MHSVYTIKPHAVSLGNITHTQFSSLSLDNITSLGNITTFTQFRQHNHMHSV